MAAPAEAPPPATSLVAIEIYTASRAPFQAEVDRGGGRVTDLLNTATSLSLLRMAKPEDFDVERILLVVPPAERGSDVQRHLHRMRRPVRMQIGPYEVEGQAHIPPGAGTSGYLFRVNPRFVPLTEAVVRRVDGQGLERQLPVVITNFRRLGNITELKQED